jgi:site-specific recombinase XerD
VASAATANATTMGLRDFFQFLTRQDYCPTNPLADIPALPEKALYIPFVFTSPQTDRLLNVICSGLRQTEKHFLVDMAIYLAIVLLARCGMRIREPIALMLTDYRPQEATLYIRKTKFSKDRLIPIENAVASQIDNYLSLRKRLLSCDPNPYLLAGRRQIKLYEKQIRKVFYQAVESIGLHRAKQSMGNMTFGAPVPHSLRHSFAINTLKRIRDRGGSPQNALPVLSAYMGHCKYQYTAAYLKLSDPEHLTELIDFAKSLRGL